MKKIKFSKSLLAWIVIFIGVFAIAQITSSDKDTTAPAEISYSEFVQKISSNEVFSVTIEGQTVKGV